MKNLSEQRAALSLADNAKTLMSASAVRNSARRMLELALNRSLDDWQVDLDRLPATADFVAQVVRDRYPHLNPPFHARWRHFVFDGRDLWREIVATHVWPDPAAKARAAFDLAITSVLLDAGAGPDWCYQDEATGLTPRRSEGLALASLRWFESGDMSDNLRDALRADAAALERVEARSIHAAFQVGETNPLQGAEGRAVLLNRLGAAVRARPELFGIADSPRPGGLFDVLAQKATNDSLPAPVILETLLDAFGSIWPDRPTLGGISLGDCWQHPALKGDAPADHYAALHKLSQWLTYSLIEPLEDAGIHIIDIDGLTGLAEYRNGGLFVDMGVLIPRDDADRARTHAVSDHFVVGWRSLTVALLDRIAPLVRERLGVKTEEFPLARVLEGGTWAAGRIIAREQRVDGGPPLKISSDGTVF